MPLHTDCKNNNVKTIRLLKTARGQIEGIIKMIEEERECIDISSQILATQSILKKGECGYTFQSSFRLH